MKVAYYSPLPPDRSGIADYSAHLLPALERRMDVAVVRRGRRRRAPRDADVAVYHVGNNPEAHGWIVEALRKRPGVVVLHDVVLHHLVAGMTVGHGRSEGYLDAMHRDSGVVGRLLAHGVIDGVVEPLWEKRAADFPLTMWVVEQATGIIVHSHHAQQRLRELGYGGPVWRIPMPAWPVPAEAAPESREDPVIGCFGHLTPAKQIPQLLDAFARLHARRPGARLVLAGSSPPGFDVRLMIENRGLGDAVALHGYLEEADLWREIGAADLLVNLRSPTMGETSAMVVRALSVGKPVVVNDLGWFSELPDEVAVKVPAGELETDALDEALERLSADPALRKRMGAAAVELARTEHDLERAADLYAAALEEAAGMREVEGRVLTDVARAASELGVEADSPGIAGIAGRLGEVGFRRSEEP